MTAAAPPLVVDIDSRAAPRASAWLERGAGLCVRWYPLVTGLLESPGFEPPRRLRLRAAPTIGGGPARVGTPGASDGTVITVGADWIDQHPGDTGLLLHELVHVVQRYPRGHPWWITEGIADWVRYQRVETADERVRPNLAGRSYRDGYAVAAAFLAWIEERHRVQIVSLLNTAMRRAAFSLALFPETVGTGVDQLWCDFVAAQ